MSDVDVLPALKVIQQRLRQISTEKAASVLAGGLANARIHEQERVRLIAETAVVRTILRVNVNRAPLQRGTTRSSMRSALYSRG